MNRVFKICLIWLLALALPLQGYAAGAMQGCAPVELTQAEHPHDAHAADMHHHEPAADADQSAQSAAAPMGHGTSSCSTCVACCVGAAVLPAFPDWPVVHNGPERVVDTSPPAIHCFIPAGPERPPRCIST